MRNRNLFICNSAYQLLVALWIRHNELSQVPADLIISDHMNNARVLADKTRAEHLFDDVYYVESLDYARYRTPYSTKERYFEELFPKVVLSRYWKERNSYSCVYMANPDRFSQLAFNALARDNPKIRVNLYEDALLTYNPVFRNDVEASHIEMDRLLKKLVYRYVFRRKSICDHIDGFLLFHPDDLAWNPGCNIQAMAKIDSDDLVFRSMCNRIFGYDDSVDQYDCQYLFMEESFAVEGAPVNDLELLEQLAERVGKENIMVKIHPRNPTNRFREHGFKTNTNTSIPWELIVMNLGDISDMTLITVASSSVMNPTLIFGKNVKAFSLYPCLKNVPASLQGDTWQFLYNLFFNHPEIITLCDNIDQIH